MAVEVIQAKCGDEYVDVLLDTEDALRLFPRHISIGSHGYAQVWDEGQVKTLQRWILGLARADGLTADHINGKKLDNRRANLRVVTPAESSANVSSTSLSGYRGVKKHRQKWAAHGSTNDQKFHLGTFDTIEEAAQIAHEWRVKNLPGYITDRRSV